ncbi:MAG: hypothetical protein AAFY65_17320 [Pseudomonadota bacterium]
MRQMTILAVFACSTGMALATGADTWDTDGDSALSVDEFRTGFATLGALEGFDADGNGLLNEAEWTPVLGQIGPFVNMDLNADGGVDADEFTAILFSRYDTDGSAALDEVEQALIESDLSAGGLLAN